MKPTQSQLTFAHSVRYRDAMLHAWMKRTNQGNSYYIDDVPQYIDVPTNDARGIAGTIRFCARPLKRGAAYGAYLTRDAEPRIEDSGHSPLRHRITTWTGNTLAHVTRLTARDYWAKGIDGRLYHGRHNGVGMYAKMRLAKGALQ